MYLQSWLSQRQVDQTSPDGNTDPTPTSLNLVLSSSSTSAQSSATSASSTPSSSSTSSNHSDGAVVAVRITVCIYLYMMCFTFHAKLLRQGVIISVVVVLGLLTGAFLLRRTRIKHNNPKYLPTTFLKSAWKRWDPKSKHDKLSNTDDSDPSASETGSRHDVSIPTSQLTTGPATRHPPPSRSSNLTTGVDRNTSIRSIMTLPPYNPDARQNEQVIGREGERAGIDMVVEFPETVDEEEMRREEEMEALYQVRLARRRENEEREERRRLRREARERGDFVALRELQNRPRGSSGAGRRTVEELRAEHDRIKKERQRAVSSVSYADLGVARHDGTRIRANSDESERQGLLTDAASFASSHHSRNRSNSSVITVDSTCDLPSPGLGRSNRNSLAQTPLRNVTDNSDEQAGSSPELVEHEDVPLNSPPGYENISLEDAHDPNMGPPPDYSSPVQDRGEAQTSFQTSGSRRTSRIGSIRDERRISASGENIMARAGMSPTEVPSRQGSGASFANASVPRIPSLRLGGLPEIHVNPSSPSPMAESFEDDDDDRPRHLDGHPEE